MWAYFACPYAGFLFRSASIRPPPKPDLGAGFTLLENQPGLCYVVPMATPKPTPEADPADLYAGMYIPGVTVTTEEAFMAAVDVGLADLDAGRTADFETVKAELHRIIHAAP
jgi:hypothetical protein